MQKRERRGLAVMGLAVISVALLGMGAAGKQEVRSSTKAVFVDRDGVRVAAEQVTASGTTEIAGDLGRGSLHVPFENVESISFDAAEERGNRAATIRLRNGESVAMHVRGSLSFYGQTPVGAYQIRARDLKAVEFAH
jgi:hypothetical protein